MRERRSLCSRRTEKVLNSVKNCIWMPQFALPNSQYLPTESFELNSLQGIADDRRATLIPPELRVCCRGNASPLAVVGMPKAAVNEDRLFSPRKYDVRSPRKAISMNNEAIAVRMNPSAKQNFGPRVLRLDRGHIATPLLWSVNVHAFKLPRGASSYLVAGVAPSSGVNQGRVIPSTGFAGANLKALASGRQRCP